MQVTIGGDRLGSGKKMETSLHNYGRSTHNLSQDWKSTASVGVLYPFLKIPALNGDSFDINLEAMLRTIPTKAPIFGSFKMQIDVFKVAIRLYQGILHNNPINIGLKMNQVKLPRIKYVARTGLGNALGKQDYFAQNCLTKYMGLSGIGTPTGGIPVDGLYYRELQCVPELAYYDIFKNYYANKQETNAYVIAPDADEDTDYEADVIFQYFNENQFRYKVIEEKNVTETKFIGVSTTDGTIIDFRVIDLKGKLKLENITLTLYNDGEVVDAFNMETWVDEGLLKFNGEFTSETGTKSWLWDFNKSYLTDHEINPENASIVISNSIVNTEKPIRIQSYPLENIDKMREALLNHTTLGSAFKITRNDNHYLPYSTLVDVTSANIPYNYYSMNGLVLKTYQSDIFNNWLQTDWIDGENGIAAVTAVSTSGDSFTIDALNLAQKIYNMLNRIAISGGTYQDWQKAVYTDNVIMHAETPIWCGGMSSEVVFEEVVSTAETAEERLGGLAGKGRLAGKKGGKMHIKVDEPSYIIGIVSITPRIDYTQGNDWDRTELESIDDLHKPALDGIGFQDLICEQMAYWDTKININNGTLSRNSAGKVPAWINYMTAVNKAYGEFADEKRGFMILGRNYNRSETNTIKDLTTYVEPTKYNYAFAYNKLDAQNFWIAIACDITARRKMSARVIPNI